MFVVFLLFVAFIVFCVFLSLSLHFFSFDLFVSLLQVHPRDCFVYLVSCAITLVVSVVVAAVVAVVPR